MLDLTELKFDLRNQDIEPTWNRERFDGYPCHTDACPSYDGKRCKVIGVLTERTCEPAVRAMFERIDEYRRSKDRQGGE